MSADSFDLRPVGNCLLVSPSPKRGFDLYALNPEPDSTHAHLAWFASLDTARVCALAMGEARGLPLFRWHTAEVVA